MTVCYSELLWAASAVVLKCDFARISARSFEQTCSCVSTGTTAALGTDFFAVLGLVAATLLSPMLLVYPSCLSWSLVCYSTHVEPLTDSPQFLQLPRHYTDTQALVDYAQFSSFLYCYILERILGYRRHVGLSESRNREPASWTTNRLCHLCSYCL
jgi:hypothetical protein